VYPVLLVRKLDVRGNVVCQIVEWSMIVVVVKVIKMVCHGATIKVVDSDRGMTVVVTCLACHREDVIIANR
tara:strand:+ start:122 stop:334 length:213 start_codon:yes stop_codon:yes gene_type:complete